jgi:predicted nucleic acid-binding Zn ribbon protein
VSNPPRRSAARRVASARAIEWLALERARMWVIYLEAFGVLALVLGLVWWTMRGKR